MVTTICDRECLESSNLGDMNIALLVKWISQYSNEHDKLWRRVVCAKSGADPASLSISFGRKGRRSTLANFIGSLLDRNNTVSSIVSRSFKNLIGDGTNSDFLG